MLKCEAADINWPKIGDCAKCKKPISPTASRMEGPWGVFWHSKCWPGIVEAEKLNKNPNPTKSMRIED